MRCQLLAQPRSRERPLFGKFPLVRCQKTPPVYLLAAQLPLGRPVARIGGELLSSGLLAAPALVAVEAIPAPLVNKFTEANRASERPSRAAGAPGMALFSTTKIELCMQPPQTRPSELWALGSTSRRCGSSYYLTESHNLGFRASFKRRAPLCGARIGS